MFAECVATAPAISGYARQWRKEKDAYVSRGMNNVKQNISYWQNGAEEKSGGERYDSNEKGRAMVIFG
jgi:hypothetical protein